MENKINIAELLKDCPKDMELDCTKYSNVYFLGIDDCKKEPKIKLKIETSGTWCSELTLDKYGKESSHPNAKCLIFPKDKTTWEGFVPPCKFTDGDVLTNGDTIYIYNGIEELSPYPSHYVYVIADKNGLFASNTSTKSYGSRFATEEEKQILFDAIKANGYKWNEETKTLEKLIFNKFNIVNFKPFDKVLVRDHNDCIWRADFYSHYEGGQKYWCVCVGDAYTQCIPYNKETANLLGTDHDCPSKYKFWKND